MIRKIYLEKRLTKKVAKDALINCIKVKEVGLEDSSTNISEYFCEIIVQLLSKLRNYIMIYPERIKLFEPITSLLCQKVIDKLPDLNVSNGKTIFYQICTMMNEIKTFAKVSFSGKWFDNLVTMKYGKHIVRRVKDRGTYDIKDVVEFMPSKTKSFLNNIKEPSDAIEYNNKLGYGCKVIRTNASEVEPWLLIIDYISN